MSAEIFRYLQSLGLSDAIRDSDVLPVAIQITHILGFTALLGAALAINIRAHKLGFKAIALRDFFAPAMALCWAGLATALASGTLLFLTRAMAYSRNDALAWKAALVVSALALQLLANRGMAAERGELTALYRGALAAALALWFLAAIAGRAIGFV